MTKLFTMVKDEDDIIEEWIVYHGNLFGFENLYIIDNMSSDKTLEKILKFYRRVHIFRKENYNQKGMYMRQLIDQSCRPGEIAIPLDIDEFIVFFDSRNKQIHTHPLIIHRHLKSLPLAQLYKMNYIQVLITKEEGYGNAVLEATKGLYEDYGIFAKTFFKVDVYKGGVDNGNHICNNATNNYLLSSLCLVHYHNRSLTQIKKKTECNVTGFSYTNDAESLKRLLQQSPTCQGNHHVARQISILENTYSLPVVAEDTDGGVDLTPLKETVKMMFAV